MGRNSERGWAGERPAAWGGMAWRQLDLGVLWSPCPIPSTHTHRAGASRWLLPDAHPHPLLSPSLTHTHMHACAPPLGRLMPLVARLSAPQRSWLAAQPFMASVDSVVDDPGREWAGRMAKARVRTRVCAVACVCVCVRA